MPRRARPKSKLEPTWSVERVVAELRRLNAEGRTMTYAALRAGGYHALLTAAQRFAGSFGDAARLAGVTDPGARRPWTRERVIAELRELHKDGVELNCVALAGAPHGRLVEVARRYFGGWREAVEAAGLPVVVRGPWKSWELVRDRLHALQRAGTRMTTTTLVAEGHADLAAAAIAFAGTWNEALDRAGIPVVERHERWSRERVLGEIRELQASGVSLSYGVVVALGKRQLIKAAERKFGGWAAACAVAVRTYEPLMETWTRDRILAELRARHARGESVRSTEIQRELGGLATAARRHFGGWADTIRAAGIPKSALAPRNPPTRVRWDDDRIRAAFRSARDKGDLLIGRSFPASLVQAVHRRYGSWEDAMAAAGLAEQYARDRETARARRLGGATKRALPKPAPGRRERRTRPA
jgi:hypothetical protein